MKLTNPSNDELNAALAEKVAGWKACSSHTMLASCPNMEFGYDENVAIPPFTQSADAVLPWLEKSDRWWTYESAANLMTLWTGGDEEDVEAEGPFARAAVIALLRAHGVEVEFTQ